MKSFILVTALWAMALAPVAALSQTSSGDTSAKPTPDAASPAAPNSSSAPPPSAASPPSNTNPAGSASPPTAANPGSPATHDNAANPVKPGSVRITTRAPDPDKWDGQKSANGAQRIFKCKPLACSDAETVTIGFSRSPTRHPDPQALDKLAKVDLPKSIRAADAAREILSDGADKVDTLSSKTATLKTYPAVVNESRFTRAKLAIYVNTALIFAGPVMIRVQSASQNRDLALKSLNEFVDTMKIEEGPALAPGSPEPAGVPATSGEEEQL